ncbi:hypothetical protein BLL52_2292 [Rhodoferax antarcticus ANT.BR]|uniref:Uncharacterized protein n=1 Tax=Rhodoferax antarcticus ANT.BR TaxID=1111071 RepID=A0A1Q8YDJ0_9BURK|nr:hypothetical protein BLL52_2292 [Rhodoferax antarcticus ANT.BR]
MLNWQALDQPAFGRWSLTMSSAVQSAIHPLMHPAGWRGG